MGSDVRGEVVSPAERPAADRAGERSLAAMNARVPRQLVTTRETQFARERIFKIGEHLAKLRRKMVDCFVRAPFALRFFLSKMQNSPRKQNNLCMTNKNVQSPRQGGGAVTAGLGDGHLRVLPGAAGDYARNCARSRRPSRRTPSPTRRRLAPETRGRVDPPDGCSPPPAPF